VLRLVLIALLLCLAVVATACGSGSNSYRTGVDAAQKGCQPKLKPLETQLATAIVDRRTDDAADLAGHTATALRDCANAVQAIAPPSSLKTRAATLVGTYRSLVTSLQQLKIALDTGDATPINRAIASYNDARLAQATAVAALNGA
jgi:hypothetical protein